MNRNTLTIYIRGWFLWLLALVCVYTELPAQSGSQNLLAFEFSNRNLLHTEPITIQHSFDEHTFAPSETKSASNTTPITTTNNLDFTNSYLLQDCWIMHPVLKIFPSTTDSFLSPIAKHYFIDNIFDITDNQNPFSLPRVAKHLYAEDAKMSLGQEVQLAINQIFNISEFEQNNKTKTVPTWLTASLFVLLGLVALQFSLYRKELLAIVKAFANATAAGQLYREEKSILASASNMLTTLIYSMSMGSFAFLLVQRLGNNAYWNDFSHYLLTILGVGALHYSKNMQLRFLSWLLPYRLAIDFYAFIVSNTNKVIGLGLLPMVLFLAYAPQGIQEFAFYISITSLLSVYAYRNFKALDALSDIILLHKFYFFLYLCTVEIAPLLVALKLLSIL